MSEFIVKETGLITEETRIDETAQWGSGSKIFKVDLKQGIFIGATKYDDAPFKVSFAGICNVVDIILSGGTISFGKTAYTDDTNAGYWLGNVAGVPKFNIGTSATKYFHYDGTDFTLLGGLITGGTIQTAAAGTARVRLSSSSNSLEFVNAANAVKGYITISTDDIIIDADDNIYLSIGGSNHYGAFGGSFRPIDNGGHDLGGSSNYWNNCYADQYFSGGSGGDTVDIDVVTHVGYDTKPPGVGNYRRETTLTFKGGVLTAVSAESSMIPW